MMRYLIVGPFAVLLAACGTGAESDLYRPEDIAADRHVEYTDSDLSPPVERDIRSCPENFPTGGPIDRGDEGVGPFFCEY